MATSKKHQLQTAHAKSAEDARSGVQRPRLHELTVRNFRCIGPSPVTIELDDIVVLVGPNNVGKSTILRAYEIVTQHGSKEGELELDDFPNAKIDPDNLPQIELTTVVYDDKAPGARWIEKDLASGDLFVRERWTWPGVGKPTKVGWDVASGKWDDSVGPWGAANVAQAARPEPHRVHAFDSPEEQADQVVDLLKKALTDRLKSMKDGATGGSGEGAASPYQELLQQVATLQKAIINDAQTEITQVESQVSEMVREVFPGFEVKFDARPEDDLEKSLTLFKADAKLRMGPVGGHQSLIEHQGSGARRTLLWTALRILSEELRPKGSSTSRPHLLLIDEPELCLHPDAIREACRVLYDLPRTGVWQVMVTTHSPAFLDLTRDNTTVVRVERRDDGAITGTTVFRPKRAKLDDDDRQRLKMLSLCDPYVAEFFFGGTTIVVEGDTEYTAFREIIGSDPKGFPPVHIVRARGKATIVTICKILNVFSAPYAVLHDSDRPTVSARKSRKVRTNPAWTVNKSIRAVVDAAPDKTRVRLVASVPNFEEAFFGGEAEDEKPYTAFVKLQPQGLARTAIRQLLSGLINPTKSLPQNAVEWKTLAELETTLKAAGFIP